MTQTVEIFYSFQCPYSYLAIDRLSSIQNKFDVKVLWQPFTVRQTGKGQAGGPFPPDKASYIREDVVRLARMMDMPLTIRSDWPEGEFDAEKSTRGAVVACDQDLIVEYNIKVFHKWWGLGEDPNDQSFLVELADDLDVDPNEFAGRVASADTRERVRGIFKRGRKLQVFDTPTILIGEERFFGIDRIGAAEMRLSQMESAKAAWV